MGVFAEWQPAYDEAGIVTFPVDAVAKRPRVEHYNKIGRRGSAQLAAKFGEVNALGFMCGARNNLSIVDIDECDEGLVADVFGRLGASPIVARTASGKFHVWYRHNGEGRKIRCDLFPGRAIDILGGGYALAPPSQSEKGGYEFIEGSLADLSRLRAMASIDVPANDDPEITGRGQDCDGAEEGERNITLLRICGKAAPSCGSLDALTAYALEMNAGGPPCQKGKCGGPLRVLGNIRPKGATALQGIGGCRLNAGPTRFCGPILTLRIFTRCLGRNIGAAISA